MGPMNAPFAVTEPYRTHTLPVSGRHRLFVAEHGRPDGILCDKGPGLTSQCFTDWCREKDIEIRFIQPGKPDQNAYIERFNRTYREEVLSAYLFDSLNEVREITAEWLERYNEIRPHDALGSLPPARYRERLLAAETPV